MLQRVTKRKDYLSIAASGRRWFTPSFVVQTKSVGDQEHSPHVGFTVTKKVGKAVIRNRIKRRLKEAARDVIPEYGVKGRDYVLIGRKAAYDISFDKLKSDMKWALKKLNNDVDLKKSGGPK